MENFIEKHFIPLLSFCINSSEDEITLEALKAAKSLVHYYPMEDLTQVLNRALQHKSQEVAYLSLDVLRLKHEIANNLRNLTPGEYKKNLMDVGIPFLSACLMSISDDIVLKAIEAANALSKDSEIKDLLFEPLEKMLKHKNKQAAYRALEIIRGMGTGKEIHIFEAA
jgi:hypothetical protein